MIIDKVSVLVNEVGNLEQWGDIDDNELGNSQGLFSSSKNVEQCFCWKGWIKFLSDYFADVRHHVTFNGAHKLRWKNQL